MDNEWADQTAEGDTKQFEIAPAGNHRANLVGIFDLGTHEESFQGVSRDERQVYLVWELCEEADEQGLPFLVGEKYNFSTNPKSKYRLMLEGWRGKRYAEGEKVNLSLCLGQPCVVNITHKTSAKGRTYPLVGSVAKVMKGMSAILPARVPVIRHHKSAEPVPDWCPFVLGTSVGDYINCCAELSGEKPTPAPTAVQHPASRMTTPSIPTGPAMVKQDIPF